MNWAMSLTISLRWTASLLPLSSASLRVNSRTRYPILLKPVWHRTELHSRVCRLLEPEPLCEASILLDRCWAWAAGSGETLFQLKGAGPAAVLCLAAQLRLRTEPAAEGHTRRLGRPRGEELAAELTAELEVAPPTDEVRQIATSAALEVLATNL